MKKHATAAYVMTAAFFLTGCANDGIVEALKSTETIEPIQQTIVSEINAVTKQEKGLQETFELALSKEQKTNPFTDENSAVFKNIEERKNSVKTINESTTKLNTTQKSLVENDGDKLPEDTMNSLTDSMKELSTSLNEYTKQYSKNLVEEEKYFKSLGTKEATYQTLTDGMTTVNELDTSNKEQLKKLNKQFNQLNKYRTEAEKTLNSLSDSTK
ncbi:YkyA family protein [Carnobacterium funditum]|uniref:YkyA family protein n=1 Tax=Carnobacterium funditum TaxID=2752 RepID=UPI0005560FD7|nr:YkyA family protein [Carnobacterium funditum]